MSILAAIILGAILLLYSSYLFVQLQSVLSRNLDAELKNKGLELAKTIKAFQETESPGGDIHYAAIKILNFDINPNHNQELSLVDRQWFRLIDRYDLHRDYVTILSLDGRILVESPNMPLAVREKFSLKFTELPRVNSTWRTLDFKGKELRALQMTILARDKPHYHLRIATPVISVTEFLQGRLWAIMAGIFVAVTLFSLVGLLLANQILRPVRKIAETAQSLTHEDLSRRVEVADVDTEMLFLVNAFNTMTERLEASFKHMAGIAAEMAHELKTPLAVIRGEGQMALRRQRSPEEYREVIESSIMETEKMLQVVDDLLIAANIAYDKKIFQLEPITLSEFLKDIHQKSEILSDPKNIRMELQLSARDCIINGDKVHLRRLFFNLIDNAIKTSPSGSVVPISVAFEDEGVLVSIKDEGEGIAPEDLPHIFERSFMKRKHNVKDGQYAQGNGLGLHLCRIIAEAHNGRISVQSVLGDGSVFTLFLPVSSSINRI
jgi:signal transduction histidine kinase